MNAPARHDPAETRRAFAEVVNMGKAELRRWLDGQESRSVGMLPGGGRKAAGVEGESVGHHMGERIVELLGTKAADLTEADLADMLKVVGYVHRHGAQRPAGDVTGTRWRHSLMNWGHDPLKG